VSIIQIIAPNGPSGPFLDSYTTGIFSVYGLNLLLSAYGTGAAINVRRSSDNATQDIHFLSDGSLDTAGLAAFVGANDGFVVTWYDQTGFGNNVTQATAGQQPKIVSAGTYLAAVTFDGVDDNVVCVNNNNSPATCTVYWGGTLNSTSARQIIACSDNTDTGGPTSTSAVMTVDYDNSFHGPRNKLFTSAYANAIVNETVTSTVVSAVNTFASNFPGASNATRNNVYSQGTLQTPSYSTAGTISTSTTLFASKWIIGTALELSTPRPAAISLKNFVIYEAYHSSTDVTNVEGVLIHYV